MIVRGEIGANATRVAAFSRELRHRMPDKWNVILWLPYKTENFLNTHMQITQLILLMVLEDHGI